MFRRSTIVYSNLLGTSRATHQDYLSRWKKPGDELITTVPAMPLGTNARRDQAYLWSEALFEKGDHIRLQDLQLTYSLPDILARKMGVAACSFHGYARNLGIIWKKTDTTIDPAVVAFYPQPLQISLGVQLNF